MIGLITFNNLGNVASYKQSVAFLMLFVQGVFGIQWLYCDMFCVCYVYVMS